MPNPYRGLLSSTFDEKITEFINSDNKVQVVYGATSLHSHYDREAKTIYMVDRDIQATANVTKVSYDQAYAQVLVHELGHYVYDGGDTWSYQFLNSATEFKQWFYYREGEARYLGRESLAKYGIMVAHSGWLGLLRSMTYIRSRALL
jgi:hypothetical protein